VASAGATASTSTITPDSGTKPTFSWQKACTKNPALSWLPVCDILNLINTEITNRKAADTTLQTAINNIQSTPGPAGQACWDLNNNGKCDAANEDKNGDGQCTVADCQGAQGLQGIQGPTGPAGTCDPSACQGGASKVVTTSGYENSGTNSNIAVPSGFTTDKCQLILSPAEVSCPDGYYVGSYVLNYFPSLDKNSFNLLSVEKCWEASNPSISLNTKGFGYYYLMVCTS